MNTDSQGSKPRACGSSKDTPPAPEDETTIPPTAGFQVPSTFVTGPESHEATTAPGSPHDPPVRTRTS